LVVIAVVAAGLTSLVIALPVLPADDAGRHRPQWRHCRNHRWPEFVETIATVYRGPAGGGRAVILAGNYGEARAIDRFGPALGLPRSYSGHRWRTKSRESR